MSEEDLHAMLQGVAEEFDLGTYEIDAYLAVLKHGELTAAEIAAETEVPQPRVYDTVRALADRGLVEIRESRPMRVLALKPENAFLDIQRDLEDLVSTLEDHYRTPSRSGEAVSLIRSRDTILRHFEAVVEAAEYELTLSLTPSLLDRLEADLAAAIDRGVRTMLLVTPAAEAPDPEAYDYTGVATEARARRGVVTPVLAVADGSRSVYATQEAIRDGTDRYAVLFNRSALGFLVLGFFGTVLWTTADTLAIADPEREFPRRYASVRRAIKDIEGVRADLYATVDGRDVVTGESRIVRGHITETHLSDDETLATITVATEDGDVRVGGRVAALEDIETREIRVNLGSPPELRVD
jgi:sugar-specific transcriptional regulator TrmB